MFRAGRISLADFTNQFSSILSNPSQPVAAHAPTCEKVCLDVDRPLRCGFPEVIYGPGKSPAAIREAIDGLLRHDQAVLITRIDESIADEIHSHYSNSRYSPQAGTLTIGRCAALPKAKVAIVTAGTSDYRVAAEAWETLFWMGIDADLIQDVGVAGPQRLQAHLQRLLGCDAVIAIAGFEGALPSVVGGHLDCPVIAVPTSNGCGVGWPGFAPLLAMLNSCSPNVAVVNVDSGFKAGYLTGLIAKAAVVARVAIPASENGSVR